MTTHWSHAALAAIVGQDVPTIPRIERRDAAPILPGIDLWDLWPVQRPDGTVAEVAGGALWMLLSADAEVDPDARHAAARIRLMHRTASGWADLGPAMPDGLAPGSREWAGSAVLADDLRTLTLYFTAAGHRGEATPSFDQRLFETRAVLRVDDGAISLSQWSTPVESIAADGAIYMHDMAGGGGLGTIKAFRDPSYFRDPADEREYLLFTGSLAASHSEWNGAIGIARREDGAWRIGPPIIEADGVNNELERPHIVMHQERYHCFWSTQAKVFAPDVTTAPTGLYGMVADRLEGPWRPLNRTGLVLANPADAPFQAYSWLVLSDLTVVSFVDLIGLDRPPHDPVEARAHFGGTPAPTLRLAIDGDQARLA